MPPICNGPVGLGGKTHTNFFRHSSKLKRKDNYKQCVQYCAVKKQILIVKVIL